MKKIINNETFKVIALIAMVMDHISYLFLDSSTIIGMFFRVIGRIAFPVFAFLIVEGYHKSKNAKKYLLRLGVMALVSQIAYMFFTNNAFPLNTIFTLFLGLLAVFMYNSKDSWDIRFGAIFILIMLSILGDYGIFGISLILLFEIFYKNRNLQILSFIVMTFIVLIFNFGSNAFYIYTGLLLFIPLLYLYNGKRKSNKTFKWFFYYFYPLHLVILKIIFLLVN